MIAFSNRENLTYNFNNGEYYEATIRAMGGRADASRRGIVGTSLDAADFDLHGQDLLDGIIDLVPDMYK